ncbi:alpha/beta-hydrolase, partial [Ascobolus immersus RN42]
MRFFILSSSLLCLALPFASSSPEARRHPIVKTTSGVAYGLRPDPTVESFLGIPYAHPPIGSLRFKPPKPLHSPQKVINATQFGFACYGGSPLPKPIRLLEPLAEMNEDCLHINVWRPTKAGRTQGGKGKGLPVLVWIYGGGFVAGSNSDPMYDGLELVRNTQNTILVEINYRVGIQGFPITPALNRKEINAGILDQRLGLEWVRDNIASFGGDPSRMTLFGESAGGAAVDYHAYAFAKDPIVSAFIMQSGQWNLYNGDQPDGEGTSWKLATDKLGCTDLKDRKKELKCMQNVDAKTLHESTTLGIPGFMAVPHVDGYTVFGKKEFEKRMVKGQFAKLPTLIGTTHTEGDLLNLNTPENLTLTDELTARNFNCPAAAGARFRAIHKVPVWRYRFMGAFPSSRFYPSLRAYHTIDLVYLFGAWRWLRTILPSLPEPQQYELDAERWMQKTWTDFAVDPKRALSRKGWKQYDP